MSIVIMSLTYLSDVDLITHFQDLIVDEREKLVLQLEHIIELDRRKLFFHYSSLRAYLVEEHGIEEWNAERKIRAARLLKRFPELKARLESGKLNLTLLEFAQGCAHRERLSDPELIELLDAISGMSCRAAKREIASRFPESIDTPRDRIRPLTDDLSEVTFVAHQSLLDKLDEIRGLLVHSHPSLKLGELIEHLADDYHQRNHPEEKAKRAAEREAKKKQSELVDSPTAPKVQSPVPENERRVPSQSLKHELVRQNGYQCSYIDPITKQSCFSRVGIEVDHVRSWSSGGVTTLSNIRLLCKNHHSRISFLEFGESSKYSKSTKPICSAPSIVRRHRS